MGDFNHSGNLSRLPIKYDDDIVVLVGIRTHNIDTMIIGCSFIPLTLPIRGKYNDYGGIAYVKDTPCTRIIKTAFGISAEDLVNTAERIECGCEDQVKDNIDIIYNKIKEILGAELDYINDFSLGYFMEHEKIFDEMISMGDISLKEKHYWRIPHNYIEALGYNKKVLGKKNNYDLIEWTHDSLPTLKEEFYIWLSDDFNNYSKISHTLSDLCKRIGCDTLPEWDKSYLEYCFEENMNLVKTIKLNVLETMPLGILYEKFNSDDYSFFNSPWAKYGLFKNYPELYSNFYCSIFDTRLGEHLKDEYKNEFIDFAAFMLTMRKLCMTWGVTAYVDQDIDYKSHVRFAKCCSNFIENKYEEYEKYC